MIVEHEDTVVFDKHMTMEEIMDRDQRTTCHRVQRIMSNSLINDTRTIDRQNKRIFNNRSGNDVDTLCCGCRRRCNVDSCDECGVICFSKNGIKRRGHRITSERSGGNTWLRLGSLLLTLIVVSVQGAPTMTLQNRRLNSPEKWMTPCGEGLATEDADGEMDYSTLTDAELLNPVAVVAKTALNQAAGFRDNYINQMFNTNFTVLHSEWRDKHYDWLPRLDKIPKHLGEPLAPEYLNQLRLDKLDNILLDVYEYLQTYAVGLEQIVWDQEDHQLEFVEQFKEIETSLKSSMSGRNITEPSGRNIREPSGKNITEPIGDDGINADVVWPSVFQVLCELQTALIERGVTPRNNISRKTMPNEFREMSSQATYRHLRDWLIFRDYMNGLEYVVEVFGHLSSAVNS